METFIQIRKKMFDVEQKWLPKKTQRVIMRGWLMLCLDGRL